MQRKTAKQILAESFREVAQTKSIDKITVRDNTENCGYSGATTPSFRTNANRRSISASRWPAAATTDNQKRTERSVLLLLKSTMPKNRHCG